MTLRTPPSWLQNGSHPAENDRLSMQALYATTGIIGSTSLAVTANSPAGMSVLVAEGWAAIVGTTQIDMGVYTVYNDATTTLTITTADPTNARIDRIVVTVQDAYYTGAFNDVVFQVVAGTPSGSPVAPATPANAISLATISVGAGATSIVSGAITDTRVDVTTNLPVVYLTTAQTLTNKTLTAPTINDATNNFPIIKSAEERTNVVAAAATGTINYDVETAGIWYYTSNASGNHTLNFRFNASTTLSSKLAVGDAITLVWLNTNGATPYYPSVIQIDSVGVTPKWQGGTTPIGGNASSIDAYVFAIIKTAATPTYTVIASQTKYA